MHVARRMWALLEPYHAVVYFAPGARAAYEAVGLRGYWMGYFASRAAAMGAVPAEVVCATFYNFHPRMVRRAIPDAWRFATPGAVLEARLALADAVLRALLEDIVDGEAVERAAAAARRVAERCDAGGRPLFAAHASLPWPEQPHLALWHAATLLREHRGDGHVAVLLAHELDGCDAHVLMATEARIDPERQRDYRGWSEGEWREAEERLLARGLLDATGGATAAGAEVRASVEAMTDRLAERPYRSLDDGALDDLRAGLAPTVRRILERGGIAFPNPMGLLESDVPL